MYNIIQVKSPVSIFENVKQVYPFSLQINFLGISMRSVTYPPKFISFLKFIALGIMQELQGLSFATLILFRDFSVKEYQNST